eukprot:2841569-Pleurochrysis_carterae.AAC.1
MLQARRSFVLLIEPSVPRAYDAVLDALLKAGLALHVAARIDRQRLASALHITDFAIGQTEAAHSATLSPSLGDPLLDMAQDGVQQAVMGASLRPTQTQHAL